MSLLLTLREINHRIRCAILRFRPELRHCSAISPSDFSSLLADLQSARSCLTANRASASTQSAESQAVFAEAVREYRANLQDLRHILPDLHARLLAEKLRLQKALTHADAASAWAKTSSKTLQK